MILVKSRNSILLIKPKKISLWPIQKIQKGKSETKYKFTKKTNPTTSQYAPDLTYHERMFIPSGRKVPNLCAKCISVNLRLAPSPEFCQTAQMDRWSAQCPGRWKCSPIQGAAFPEEFTPRRACLTAGWTLLPTISHYHRPSDKHRLSGMSAVCLCTSYYFPKTLFAIYKLTKVYFIQSFW